MAPSIFMQYLSSLLKQAKVNNKTDGPHASPRDLQRQPIVGCMLKAASDISVAQGLLR